METDKTGRSRTGQHHPYGLNITMDPNATLELATLLANQIVNGEAEEGDAEDLAELVLSLDDWLKRGGFLPSDWKHLQAQRESSNR